MTRAHTYRSLAELWGDSTKLVEADVVGVEDVPAGPDDMLEAKVTVRVRRLLASKPDRGTLVREEGTVVVRQIGHVGVPLQGGIDILSNGRRYVLFLAPLERKRDRLVGEWTISGPEGAYLAEGRDHLRRVDPDSMLPASIDLGPLVAQALAVVPDGARPTASITRP